MSKLITVTAPLHGTIKNDGLSSYDITAFNLSIGVRDDGTGFLAVEIGTQQHVMQLSADARRHLAALLYPEGAAA